MRCSRCSAAEERATRSEKMQSKLLNAVSEYAQRTGVAQGAYDALRLGVLGMIEGAIEGANDGSSDPMLSLNHLLAYMQRMQTMSEQA